MIKRIVILLLTILSFSTSHAILHDTGKFYTINGVNYKFYIAEDQGFKPRVLIPLIPIQDCSVLYIVADKDNTEEIIDQLQKYNKKLEKWQKTAYSENVTNLDKHLGNFCFGNYFNNYYAYSLNDENIRFVDGQVNRSNMYNCPQAQLHIDDQHICHIQIAFQLNQIKLTDGSGSVGANNKGVMGQSYNTQTIQPAGGLSMDKDDVNFMINTLNEILPMLDSIKDNRDKRKLFK